jgi:transaldolase
VQRPPWASTSTKNPNYPDTLYVDALIGPDTVNTLPGETLAAFRDHGCAAATLERDVAGAKQVLSELEAAGIAMEAITTRALDEGLSKFQEAFDRMIGSIQARLG